MIITLIFGDEFVVLPNCISEPEYAVSVAEKTRLALEQPFELGGHRLHISSSIGIAVYPEHGEEDRQSVRHADNAMCGAKRQGGNPAVMNDMPLP